MAVDWIAYGDIVIDVTNGLKKSFFIVSKPHLLEQSIGVIYLASPQKLGDAARQDQSLESGGSTGIQTINYQLFKTTDRSKIDSFPEYQCNYPREVLYYPKTKTVSKTIFYLPYFNR